MLFHWFKPDPGTHEELFVEKVTVRRPWRPVDSFVIIGWALIIVKCILASLAIHHWNVPIHDFYVWGPSFMLGGACTYLYLRGEQE